MGIHSRMLRTLVDEGDVERVARGLYRVAEVEPTEHYTHAAVCARVPGAIICLLTALRIHELGTQLPHKVWIAIPHKARTPRVAELPIRAVRFSGASLRYGVVDTAFGGRSRPDHKPGTDRCGLFPLPAAVRRARRARSTTRRSSRP